ncbi:MAG: hypothetical protein ACXABO_02670 [Promethearchaeota archaeon]|jgi:hypothetical protein
MEFTKKNYSRSITSKCWAYTPLDAGWLESVKYGEDLPNNLDVKKIFELEMSIPDIPCWAEELAVSQIANIPMCGHYLFPKNVKEILEGIRDEKTIDFFTSCYTVPPDRKATVEIIVKILEAWLNEEEEKTFSFRLNLNQEENINNKVIENIYLALGKLTQEKVVQVKRLRNRLKWWIKTFIWRDYNHKSFTKDIFSTIDKSGNKDYGNKGFSDPYFTELELEENKNLENKILENKNLDSKIITLIHSTWLCAPKFFRYLEKIILKIGHSQIDVFPDKLTSINKQEYGEKYYKIINGLLPFVEEKKKNEWIGDHTAIKEWLVRILLLKLKLYEKHCPFGRLIRHSN